MRHIWVTGGRSHEPTAAEAKAFAQVLHELTWGEPCRIGHGACSGVDAWVDEWARSRLYEVVAMPADWERLGNAAGPVRNGQGIDWTLETGACVGFQGAKGTADCLRQALAAKRETVVIRDGEVSWLYPEGRGGWRIN